MPSCRSCGTQWPAEYVVCPSDGTRMVDAQTAISVAGSVVQTPSRDDDLVAGQIAGEYVIEKKLGEGGMGSVYGARHPVIGKRGAVKVLRSELSASQSSVDRFVLEAQAVNQIGHPNMVDVFAFGRLDDGRFFFIMEWLQGRSLRERLAHPMPYAEAIDILDTIAKTLQAAHDAGVIHRDLKPDNVFLAEVRDDRPSVKLLDFGLAKLSNPTVQSERTGTGVMVGTPLYVSPEQAKGTKIDPATDIYSLGVVAYEMLTGRVPFTADSAVEIMAKHISDPVVPPRAHVQELPAEVDQLIVAMLAKEPARRPALREIRSVLAGARSHRVAPVAPVQPMLPPPTTLGASAAATSVARVQRSRRGVVLASAIAFAAIAVVVVVLVTTREPTVEVFAPPAKRIEVVAKSPEPEPSPPGKLHEPAPAELVEPGPVPVPVRKATSTRPTPKQIATFGTVRVTVRGALRAGTLYVDGKLVNGRVLELVPGKHTLRVEIGPRRSGTAAVTVIAGKTHDVQIQVRDLDGPRDPFPDQQP